VPLVGAFLERSAGEVGLCIGFFWDGLEAKFGTSIREDDLPGVEADRAGFLNSNRYLRTVEEAEAFWAALGSSDRLLVG
jgi:hypothetical protein